MTEPETEIDALDRLEAALHRIATHTPRPAPAVAAALDRVIVQLKDALSSIDQAERT